MMLRAKFLPLILIFILACQSPKSTSTQLAAQAPTSYSLNASVYNTEAQENPNTLGRAYVSLAVPFTAIQELKAQLVDGTGLTLRDRGEAHITVLTPPELATLRKRLSADAVFRAVGADSIQEEKFDVVCVGEGKKANRRVYFAVVKAAGLVERRQRLAAAFKDAGGAPGAFEAEFFHPHITIGFTHSDLFQEDGVIKDEHSCVAPVVISP